MKRTLLLFILPRRVCVRLRSAHEVRPAYLELRQTGAGNLRRALEGAGPGRKSAARTLRGTSGWLHECHAPRGSMVNNAFTERWTVKRAGGLTGGTIHIAGLTATMTDVLVRLERLDGTTQVTRLTPSAPSFVVEAAPRALEVAAHLSDARRRAYPSRH